MSNWIYRFQGRNSSGAYDQNFLWNSDNVYVMDNHRAALWCWLRHMTTSSRHRLFHIDAHYDAAPMNEEDIHRIPDLSTVSFDEFLGIQTREVDGESIPLIRWDNYLYLFAATRHQQISECFGATHCIGEEPPETLGWYEVLMNALPDWYALCSEQDGKDDWILNIDLDYFFFFRDGEVVARLQSDDYISEVFRSTKEALRSGKVTCLTICLSPECSGGWKSAEALCYQLCDVLGLDFRLPARGCRSAG